MAVPAMVPFTVFSAHAEVVPHENDSHSDGKSILRARGGSSFMDDTVRFRQTYSPRTRR